MQIWFGARGADLTVEHYLKLVGIERGLRALIDDPHQPLDLLADRRGHERVSSLCRAWRREVGITPGIVARWLQSRGNPGVNGRGVEGIVRELDELVARRAGERERERERESSRTRTR